MSGYVKKTNYNEESIARLRRQYKGKSNTEKFVTIQANQAQIREDSLSDLYDLLFLDGAYGIHLDYHGEVLNVLRGTDNDTLYRLRIKTAIHELNNAGQIEPLISAYKSLIGANRVILDEYYPHTVILTGLMNDTTISDPDTINTAMQRVRAAGIEMQIGVAQDGASFRFASVTGQTGTGRGFSSTALGGDGGKFAKIVK